MIGGNLKSIKAQELSDMMNKNEDFTLLDVREDHELEIARINHDIHIPMGQIPKRMSELDKNNKIVVGPKRYLSCDEFSINECNWITDSDKNKFDALVKLRNTAKPVQVKIQTDLEKSSASVMLKNPEFGISPGQAAVFYDLEDKNRVLGGGWIKSTKNYLNG